MKYLVINRINIALKKLLRSEKKMEFLWKNPYENTSLLTHLLYKHVRDYFAL